MTKSVTVKTFIAFIALTCVLSGIFNSCTKDTIINNYTDTLILPTSPAIIPTTITNGDTTVITVDGITIHYYSTSPCAPSNEVFYFWVTAPSLPANTVYTWYYGDGYNDNGISVSHLFNSGGKRTLLLQISINGSIVTTLTTTVLSWGQNVTPTAGFYSSLNDINNPNWVAFNSTSNVSSGAIVKYQWDFNDGTADSTSMSYHEHYFPNVPQDKTYNVKLTAVSQAGCKGSTTQPVTVPASYNLPCKFTYTNSNPCSPNVEQTNFTADPTGVPSGVMYYWNYSDGITDSTRNYTISHQFIYHGTKAVQLNIKLNGRTLCNAQNPVMGATATPTAYISQATTGNTSNQIFFNSGSWANDGYTITNYVWNFGDNTSDNNNDPGVLHTYPGSGTYTASLTVTIGQSGCSNTTTKTVTIP